MSKQLIAVVAGALALVVLVAGCGGGDDAEGEVTTASISKAEFIEQADKACEKGEKQSQFAFGAFAKEKEDEGVTNPGKDDYLELIAAAVTPQVEQEVEEIRELGAPKGDEQEIEEFLEAREESIELAEENPEEIVTNTAKIFGESSQIAREYGLEACALR